MQAPSGWEHLGQAFWDRVEPDPDSDCLIFQSTATRLPLWNGKSMLTALTGDNLQKYRVCLRRMCVNPEHIEYGHYEPPRPKTARPHSAWQFARQYSQC